MRRPMLPGSSPACISQSQERRLKAVLRRCPYIERAGLASREVPRFRRSATMQTKFHLKQLTVALAAAGFGLAVGTGYNRLDAPALSLANAAVTAPAVTSPVAATAAARLPDFTALVDRAGAAVVNISTGGTTRTTGLDQDDEDNPLHEFLKRFGMPNGGPGLNIQPRAMPSRGVGSGFIVSPDGYIVTNAHVVDGANEVTVRLTDRREFTAKVVGTDKRTDIALIKI